MGFFDKLRKSMPGNPTSVAKTMLKIYTSYLAVNRDVSKADALRYCIESRYQMIKKMNQGEIEACLAKSDTLGDLVFLCIAKESPLRVKHPYIKKTVEDLYTFFKEYAPEEVGVLQQLRGSVSI
ncbi:MAG: hypothetical protein JW976_12170 [Syntrophaceae bacterium]|nr:hypothetical protein [Syntrophaceae bacterium]